MAIYTKNVKTVKTRIFHSNTNKNCTSLNWCHDWWQINHKTYANVLKGDSLKTYGSAVAKVQGQAIAVKTKQLADKNIVPHGCNIVAQAISSVTQSQGVKSGYIENDKHCGTNNSSLTNRSILMHIDV